MSVWQLKKTATLCRWSWPTFLWVTLLKACCNLDLFTSNERLVQEPRVDDHLLVANVFGEDAHTFIATLGGILIKNCNAGMFPIKRSGLVIMCDLDPHLLYT